MQCIEYIVRYIFFFFIDALVVTLAGLKTSIFEL